MKELFRELSLERKVELIIVFAMIIPVAIGAILFEIDMVKHEMSSTILIFVPILLMIFIAVKIGLEVFYNKLIDDISSEVKRKIDAL